MRVLRRGLTLVVIFVALGLAGGFAASAATPNVYRASVQLFVATSSSIELLPAGNTFTQDRVQSYISLATAPSVTAPVIYERHLHMTRQQLAGKITADAPSNKVLINLHVTDRNPRTAAVLANLVAMSFAKVVEGLAQQPSSNAGKPLVRLTIVKPAVVPGDPVSPNTWLDLAIGAGAGLLLGLGIVAFRRWLRQFPE